jgi:hypothetical protein
MHENCARGRKNVTAFWRMFTKLSKNVAKTIDKRGER